MDPHWKSCFFTKWVPGLTITICNKITAYISLKPINIDHSPVVSTGLTLLPRYILSLGEEGANRVLLLGLHLHAVRVNQDIQMSSYKHQDKTEDVDQHSSDQLMTMQNSRGTNYMCDIAWFNAKKFLYQNRFGISDNNKYFNYFILERKPTQGNATTTTS